MKIELFFDYTCPFCLKGHEYLLELLPEFPELEIEWKPTEAHPRPEIFGKHSDLCHQVLLFTLDKGVDPFLVHEKLYAACLKQRIEIEEIEALCKFCSSFLDENELKEVLASKKYEKEQSAINDYAYDQCEVWALPAYRSANKKLDAVLGVGITKAQLKEFLSSIK